MDKEIKIIYNKLENLNADNDGYIDLSQLSIKRKTDLVNICNMFRNYRYETFRIFYIKDSKIIGQEAITNRLPNMVKVFNNNERSPVRIYEKMKNRIKRLNADGYYLVHNHTSNFSKPSPYDMELTRNFYANVEGFLGHIILSNYDKYSIIEENEEGLILLPKEYKINLKTMNDMSKRIVNNKLYDINISNRDELVALLKLIQHEQEHSITILTDIKNNVRMILNIPNRMLNQNEENLNGFFKNLAKTCGGTNVFIGTSNIKAYYKTIKHQRYGTFKDMIYMDYTNNRIIAEKITHSPNLFDREKNGIPRRNREVR